MSKVLKQLWSEEFEGGARKEAQLRLVPPPPPPPDYALQWKLTPKKVKKPRDGKLRLKLLVLLLFSLSALSFRLNDPFSSIEGVVSAPAVHSGKHGVAGVAAKDAKKEKAPPPRPSHEFQLNRDAIGLFKAQKFKEAFTLFEELVETQPDNGVFWTNLGMCQLRLNDLKGAKSSFAKALKILSPRTVITRDPRLSVVYNNLGSINMSQKNWGPAILDFEKALELEPDSTEARLNLAKTYELAGRPEDAAREYEIFLASPGVNAAVKPVVKIRLAKLNAFVGYLEEEDPEAVGIPVRHHR